MKRSLIAAEGKNPSRRFSFCCNERFHKETKGAPP